MIPTKKKLWDWVNLSTIKTDKFKTGMISFSLSLPLTKELSAYNMLLSGVLRRGTELFPSAASLNCRLDELYASTIEIKNLRYGKNEVLILSADMLDNAFINDDTDVLDGIVHVISQILLHPIIHDSHFPRDTVEKEKANIRDAISAEINNPRAYAIDRCTELLHKNDKDFPTVKDLLNTVCSANEITLYKHYLRLLSETTLEIFYIGSEDTERISEIITKYFSKFCGSRSTINPIAPESFTALNDVTEPFEVSQGKLCMGFRTGICANDERYFAAVLFNEIFGGSPASKLFMNVRERLSLCYYCSSSYDTYRGNLIVSSGIDVSSVDAAKAEILRQLEDIKEGRISDVELTAAKKSITHWYRQMYDYPFELFSFYSTRNMLGFQASPEEYLQRFNAVTKEQITEVARGVILDTVYFLKGTLETDTYDEEDDE